MRTDPSRLMKQVSLLQTLIILKNMIFYVNKYIEKYEMVKKEGGDLVLYIYIETILLILK